MRKLLASVTSAAVAVCAIALAADARNDSSALAAAGPEKALVKIKAKQQRTKLRRARRRKHAHGSAAAAVSVPPVLQRIAACESGGNPSAVGGGGTFRGKYQFTYATWASVGGSGDPAAAPEAEQDRRAATLYARSGSSQWPVCGR